MSNISDFEFKHTIFLGGKISSKEEHKAFKILAKLGFKDAETMAFFLWLNELDEEISFADAMIKLTELMGMAHFLPHTKELTRLSMILGDTGVKEQYE